jgi:hypothetical protein
MSILSITSAILANPFEMNVRIVYTEVALGHPALTGAVS